MPEPNEGQEQGEQRPAASPAAQPQTYEVIVKGQTRQVTLEELKTLATKSAGADEAFRQAAEIRKEAERLKAEAGEGARVRELIQKTKAGTITSEEVEEYAQLLGVELPAEEENVETEGTAQGTVQTQRGKVQFDDLDPDLQQEIKNARAQTAERQAARIRGEIYGAVAADKELARMLRGDEEAAKVVRDLAVEEVERRALVYGEQYGPELLGGVVQSLRAKLSRLRKPGQGALGDQIGFGEAPASEAMQPDVEEPAKRVPVGETERSRYILNRMRALSREA